jgi:hypothetical protein
LHGAALRHRADAGYEPCSGPAPPSLFGLAPCGVYPASVITAGAVRSYRTFSPLPLHEATPKSCPAQQRYVFCGTGRPQAFKPASRTLSGTLPCGVRTFLSRISQLSLKICGSDRPVLLPGDSLPRIPYRGASNRGSAVCQFGIPGEVLLTRKLENLQASQNFSSLCRQFGLTCESPDAVHFQLLLKNLAPRSHEVLHH